MSIKITSWVWENGPTDQGELLVLLALADFANDDGVCWPSVASIATKARLTERGAQKIVRRLEANGRLSIDTGGGRHGCNTYRINTDPPEPETPNAVHPEQGSPRTTEQKPRTRVQKTPNPGSPEPSGTIKNRQSSRARAREAASPENEASQIVVCASQSANSAPSDRERLLAAMGVRPDGVTGPARFIGTEEDMVEAGRWSEMGISIDRQCRIILDICRRQRSYDPNWMPRRFRYFTGAMNDAVNPPARSPEMSTIRKPQGETLDQQRARWRKIAQQ